MAEAKKTTTTTKPKPSPKPKVEDEVEEKVESKMEDKEEVKQIKVKILHRWLKPDGMSTAEVGDILTLDSKIADNLIKYKIAIKEE